MEGQEVEVLDSKGTSHWLVRYRDKETKGIRQGWVPASHLTTMMYRSSTMTKGVFRRQQSIIVDVAELNSVDRSLSRKAAESLIKRG